MAAAAVRAVKSSLTRPRVGRYLLGLSLTPRRPAFPHDRGAAAALTRVSGHTPRHCHALRVAAAK